MAGASVPRVPLRVACAAAALVAVGACGGSDPVRTVAPTKTASTSTTVTANRACAWPWIANRSTMNIAYPDTHATYWTFPVRLGAQERLVVTGRLPRARYSSFVTYDAAGVALDGHADSSLVGASADTAPPTPGTQYTLTIAPTAHGRAVKTLVYRVYLPHDTTDPTGGGALPHLGVVAADGTRRSVVPCARSTANPEAERIVRERGPATTTPAPARPVFVRPRTDGAGLYPNPDNTYLATILHHTPGSIVVVRGTLPRTSANAVGAAQLRYWSLCTNEYRAPYPVSSCVADRDLTVDDSGAYTVVVSTPADRPADADTAHGVTWLDWGSTRTDVLLLVREMLPAPDYAEAAARLVPGALAMSSMGRAAPRGTICTRTEFERHSSACGS